MTATAASTDTPHEVGDLPPDREVYRTTYGSGGSRTRGYIHLTEDCTKLQRARKYRAKRAAVLWDDTPICKECREEGYR